MGSEKLNKLLFSISLWLAGGAGAALAADEPWQNLLREAYVGADVVLKATIVGVDDQRAIDGGHVYTLSTDAVYKGTVPDEVTVRAGGWMYTLVLKEQQAVVMFVQKNSTAHFGLVTAPGFVPMAFDLAGGPLDGRLTAQFATVSAQDFARLIAELGGAQ